MKMYSIKLGDTAVYDENISIKVDGLMSKYVWYGNIIYMPYYKNQIYIPANSNGWRWILHEEDLGYNQSTLRLYSGDNSKSYIAIHFNNLDAAPHPMQFSLNMPEFLGNYVVVNVSDDYEREKNIVHLITEPLDIGPYTVKFTDLKKKKVELEIYRNVGTSPSPP